MASLTSYICTSLRGRIKGKSRDANLMYPWGDAGDLCPGGDAALYMGTTKPLLIVGLNLLIILSL